MPGYLESQRLQAGTHHTPERRLPAAQEATAHALPPGAAQATPPGTRLDIPLADLSSTMPNRDADFLAAGFAPRLNQAHRFPSPDSASVLRQPLDPLVPPLISRAERGASEAATPRAHEEDLPANLSAAGGRRVEGPEDFNAYEVKRVEQADKALKLAKFAIGATVTVGIGGIVIGGLNLGSHSGSTPQPTSTPYVSPNA